jgi:hypothetical protein
MAFATTGDIVVAATTGRTHHARPARKQDMPGVVLYERTLCGLTIPFYRGWSERPVGTFVSCLRCQQIMDGGSR